MRQETLKSRLRKIANDNPYKDVAEPGVMLKERLSSIMNPLAALSFVAPSVQHSSAMDYRYPASFDKKYSATSFIPGVGGWREESRHRRVDDKVSGGENKRRSRISEGVGLLTSTAVSSLLGAILTPVALKLMGAKDIDYSGEAINGALYGYFGGLGANLLGGWAGLARKARTKEEHKEYLKESVLKNYLIPGLAGYNAGRRDKMALYDNI